MVICAGRDYAKLDWCAARARCEEVRAWSCAGDVTYTLQPILIYLDTCHGVYPCRFYLDLPSGLTKCNMSLIAAFKERENCGNRREIDSGRSKLTAALLSPMVCFHCFRTTQKLKLCLIFQIACLLLHCIFLSCKLYRHIDILKVQVKRPNT